MILFLCRDNSVKQVGKKKMFSIFKRSKVFILIKGGKFEDTI